MRVLLTGASGFVGSAVARQLAERGHEVHALLRPGSDGGRLGATPGALSVHRGDLADDAAVRAAIAAARPDACVHAAWFVEPGAWAKSRENLAMSERSQRLALGLLDAGCPRLIGLGTGAEYDSDQGWLSESSRLGPRSLYGACKLGLGQSLLQLGAATGMQVAWARLFYLYGPAEDPRRLVASVARSLLRGEAARCSEGRQVRDFLDVDDVASALVALAESSLVGAINVASGVPVTVRAVAERLGALAGRPDLLHFGAVAAPPDDPPFVVANVQRLTCELGWAPRYSLDAGLGRALEWWRGRA